MASFPTLPRTTQGNKHDLQISAAAVTAHLVRCNAADTRRAAAVALAKKTKEAKAEAIGCRYCHEKDHGISTCWKLARKATAKAETKATQKATVDAKILATTKVGNGWKIVGEAKAIRMQVKAEADAKATGYRYCPYCRNPGHTTKECSKLAMKVARQKAKDDAEAKRNDFAKANAKGLGEIMKFWGDSDSDDDDK